MKALPLLLLLWPSAGWAQLNESFDDGDFIRNPAWTGDTALWEISEGRLHSRLKLKTSDPQTRFYLSTSATRTTATIWEFWGKLGFNTSSKNFIQVYLTSQNEAPHEGSNYGYFVMIGGTKDKISLMRRDSLAETELITGQYGATDHSSNTIKIKVICDNHHRWTLYTDISGTGTQYLSQGTIIDSTYLQSQYFSIVVWQKGKGASQEHWFDDIFIRPYVPDTLPPVLKKVTAQDVHHLQLHFSETLANLAENPLHYVINQKINPDSARLLPPDQATVLLHFKKTFQQKEFYALSVHGITDSSGNILDTVADFTFFRPEAYDIVISEVYPDPTPSHGLPEQEYVEIRNSSGFPVDLEGWQLCDPVRCAIFPQIVLPPDSTLILCELKYREAFLGYGRTLGLQSFPSLNNTGDELILKDASGKIIYTLKYDKKSYHNDEKAKGGWSIEMKNPLYPCLVENNWSASNAPLGGTPGTSNSRSDKDIQPFLDLQSVKVMDSLTLQAGFNAGLDPTIPKLGDFTISNNTIDSFQVLEPSFKKVQLRLHTPLKKGKAYTLQVSNLTSCNLVLGSQNKIRFGLPEKVWPGDLFITEILFNPRPGSSDFIEIYNASTKIIDIRSLQLANRDKNGETASAQALTFTPFYIFPHQYIVITTNKVDLLEQYFCKDPTAIVEADRMPSYPNLSGTAVLIDTSGQIIDEVTYREDQHNPLFHNKEGVSLEKLNVKGPSDATNSWASASSIAGYATPTYQNSQYMATASLSKKFKIEPDIFSPDGDGMDDFTILKYDIPPGFSAHIWVYNEAGIPVRQLRSNVSLGTHGKIKWNGKNDKSHLLPTGIYIFYITLYHPSGTVSHIKLPVVLVKVR